GHGLADDDRARLAQRRNARRVALRAPAGKEWRTILGRHVGSLDDVLDAERHAVDWRARPAVAPARRGLVGGGARAGKIEVHERADLGLERSEIGETALKEGARAIGAGGKVRRGAKGRVWSKRGVLFRGQHRATRT